jgi:L-arabinokinase
MNPVIVFAISGHGFGHASRQIEIMRTLRRLRPDARFHIRTSAPRWFFERALDFPFSFEAVELDTGVVQVDSLEVDVRASIDAADRFHRTLRRRIEAEARALQARGADLVVADIPPLACAAAARAGIPAIAVANFTWDWIYAGYPETAERAPGLVRTLRDAYSTAAGAWRLPLHGGFDAFHEIAEAPLVARRSAREPDAVRRRLGLPRSRVLALFAFGRYGIGSVDWQAVARSAHCHVVFTTGPHAPLGPDGDGFTTLVEDELACDGIGFEDLVAAVDVVVTKPGYGIIAECAANDTALLYTSRGRFPEYDILVSGLPELARAAFIGHGDLFAGRWGTHLDRLLAQPRPAAPAADGARVVADALAKRLTR